MKKESIEEFLKRGGKVEKCKPGMAYNMGSLDKSKKHRWTREEVERGEASGTAPLPDLTSRQQVTYGGTTVEYGDRVPVVDHNLKKENDLVFIICYVYDSSIFNANINVNEVEQ